MGIRPRAGQATRAPLPPLKFPTRSRTLTLGGGSGGGDHHRGGAPGGEHGNGGPDGDIQELEELTQLLPSMERLQHRGLLLAQPLPRATSGV